MPATTGNDTLSTTADGEVLDGLAGDDTLTSNFNDTTLIGSDGDDTLTTTLSFAFGQVSSASATQVGNTGKDRLKADVGASGALVHILLEGGAGDDQLDARAYVPDFAFSSTDLLTETFGGTGNDTINVSADLTGSDGTARNVSFGGAGDDRITATAQTFFFGFSSSASNIIHGGAGNDTIDARGSGISNGGDVVLNSLTGGSGKDHLKATAFTGTNSSIAQARNELSGDQGNDRLEAFFGSSGGDLSLTVTSVLSGGVGNDSLLASSSALTDFSFGGRVEVRHQLEGGQSNDTVTSLISAVAETFDLHAHLSGGLGDDMLDASIDAAPGVFTSGPMENTLEAGAGNDDVTALILVHTQAEVLGHLDLANNLYGGAGNDRLQAAISVIIADDIIDFSMTYDVGSNHLNGGAGNDVLTGRIDAETNSPFTTAQGFSALYGEAGNDRLTVFGGTGNILDGGHGNDKLNGGDGQDRFSGGEGADTFAFAARDDSSSAKPDQITDFSREQGDKIDLTPLSLTPADLVIRHGLGNNYTAAVDFDHDGTFDFGIAIVSAQPLATSDFLF